MSAIRVSTRKAIAQRSADARKLTREGGIINGNVVCDGTVTHHLGRQFPA
jgi:hypothetical protein